jgi:hypothetical protein
MVNFLDVTPSAASVKLASLGNIEVDVPGVNIQGLAHLFTNNPDIANLFTGKGFNPDNMDEIISLGSKFISEFLAAGLGHAGNQEVIDKCAKLPPGDVWELGEKIIEVSFPGGAKNFLDKVTATGNSLAKSLGTDAQAIKGTVKSKGKPKQSQSSEQSRKVASS